MLTIEERTKNATKRVAAAQSQQRVEAKQAREEQAKKNRHRNYIIGELVSKYFPEVCDLEPGTQDENAERFLPLECFLAALSYDTELVEQLKKRARYMVDTGVIVEESLVRKNIDV